MKITVKWMMKLLLHITMHITVMSYFSVGRRGGGADWSCTGADLEHVYFTHSVSVLGRLLLFERGRQLFPLSINEDNQGLLLVFFFFKVDESPVLKKSAYKRV